MPYGQLEVTVVEGRELRDKTNPYVSLSLDKQNKQNTRAIRDAGSEATWNEKFTFDIVEGRNELFLEAFNNKGGDELIGGAAVPLHQAFRRGYSEQWFNITRPSGRPAGEIHLFMSFEDQGPTSGPPGHTPYPIPSGSSGSSYFSPPNSGSGAYQAENSKQQGDFINTMGPEGGAIPSDYGSGAPPSIKVPYSIGPPAYPTAKGGFPDPSSLSINMPLSDYKPHSSE